MKVYYKGKSINIYPRKLGKWGMGRGLMFRRRSKILLFPFKKEGMRAIHSFFVFFPFIAVWLDDKNRVIEVKIVRPFKPRVVPSRNFKSLVEVPLNSDYMKIVTFLVGKQKGLNTSSTRNY